MDLPILSILCKRNPVRFDFCVWLPSLKINFAWYISFVPCISTLFLFITILFYRYIIVGLFASFCYSQYSCRNCVEVFMLTHVFNFLGYITRCEIAGSYDSSMFKVFRQYKLFQSGCTVLHSSH